MLADIHEECNKFGTVLRVIVPRPPVPAQVRTAGRCAALSWRVPRCTVLCILQRAVLQRHTLIPKRQGASALLRAVVAWACAVRMRVSILAR